MVNTFRIKKNRIKRSIYFSCMFTLSAPIYDTRERVLHCLSYT